MPGSPDVSVPALTSSLDQTIWVFATWLRPGPSPTKSDQMSSIPLQYEEDSELLTFIFSVNLQFGNSDDVGF